MKKGIMLFAALVSLAACGKQDVSEEKETIVSETEVSETVVSDTVSSSSVQSEEANGVEVSWNVIPEEGIVSGDYYKISERFRQGHEGILEVIVKEDQLEYVYFNEYTRPNYYNRYFQNVSKRMSEYNVSMKEAKGAAWIEGVLSAEAQIMENQSLTEDIETVSGASNSIEQALVPLAEKLNAEIVPSKDFNGPTFYQITKYLDNGINGILKVVVENKKIIDLHYDEVFSNDPNDISEAKDKRYAGLSKYDSVEYDEPSRIGFNVQMDELTKHVLENQDMLNIEGLPATEDTGDYKKAGYTKRNPAWDHYLELAEELKTLAESEGKL